MTKGQLEEEGASKNDALRLLSKSVGDSQMWRQKYEKEVILLNPATILFFLMHCQLIITTFAHTNIAFDGHL